MTAASDLDASTSEIFIYVATEMVVVWLAHVFAAFIGEGGRQEAPAAAPRAGKALLAELPVLESAVPTLVALAICWAAGVGAATAGPLGLAVAVSGMILLAVAAARRTGASRVEIVFAGGTALVLGALIVEAKVSLG